MTVLFRELPMGAEMFSKTIVGVARCSRVVGFFTWYNNVKRRWYMPPPPPNRPIAGPSPLTAYLGIDSLLAYSRPGIVTTPGTYLAHSDSATMTKKQNLASVSAALINSFRRSRMFVKYSSATSRESVARVSTRWRDRVLKLRQTGWTANGPGSPCVRGKSRPECP